MQNEKQGISHIFSPKGIGLLFFVISITVIFWISAFMTRTRQLTFSPVETPIHNPLMGWAPWATAKDIQQPHSLVYADLTWREFEPQKGQYDFSSFEQENQFDLWRAQGVRVVFRFVMDVPRDESHLDIPDWLYEETGGNGDHYSVEYGKGYSPDYHDPILIEAHQRAIQALGNRYGGNDFFAYVQLGSLGHWGEWHIKSDSNIRPLPEEWVRDQYVWHYLDAFPNTYLLMRRPFSIASKAQLGLYNDMTGDPDATQRWLGWIENGGEYAQTGEENALSAMPEGWMHAPIGGEQTGSLTDDALYGESIIRTVNLLSASHTTFIGPGGPYDITPGSDLQPGLDTVIARIGYRFYVNEMRLPEHISFRKALDGKIAITNIGIAPFYYPWALWFYVVDDAGEIRVCSSNGDTLMGIMPDKNVTFQFSLPIDQLEAGVYYVGVGIVDPLTGEPAVRFAMENAREDAIQILGRFEIESKINPILGLFR